MRNITQQAPILPSEFSDQLSGSLRAQAPAISWVSPSETQLSFLSLGLHIGLRVIVNQLMVTTQ